MEVYGHVTGAVSYGGVWVGHIIIEEPNGCVTGCLRCFRLLGIDGANGKENIRVYIDVVV